MIESRAFWIAEPGRGEIRQQAIPEPGDGEVLVRTLFSAISRGTEAIVFSGRVPASEQHRMRAPFQEGTFPAPVKYGYANVGRIERGRPDLVGRQVFTLFPHQTAFTISEEWVHPLPDQVPAARAVLAANLETALNGLWDARPHMGDRIAIVGAGTVGCLAAWLAGRIGGCEVELIDINPRRQRIAEALSVRFAAPDDASTDADVVIHASGSREGLPIALRLAGFESTIVEMSWYGEGAVPLALGAEFHARRLVLKSSQVGHVAASQRARWDTRRRMRLALSLLSASALDVLISGESPFETLPETMATLAAAPGDALCHRIRY